jgi:hypothetical protein
MAYTTIDDPSAHFHIHLYTGNNSNRSETNDANAGDFRPDWVWIKARSETKAGRIFDSSRGATKVMYPSATNSEATTATSLTSFDSDGFSLGSSDGINKNTITYVGWQWKANGGSTTTNDASATSVGTIDSVYQVNSTAGFSIVTHTGSGSAGNIAHGLGAVPEWVLTKNRSQAASWANYHVGAGAEYYLELDTTDAREAGSSVWGDTTPSSTTFRVGGANTKTNSSSDNFVSYCFAPIQGYSKFGSYTGNGNADGPFVYTGFKPAWLLIKESSGVEDWRLYDNKRSPFNVMDDQLFPNSTSSEATSSSYDLDFLSNGFKLRSSHGGYNTSSDTYIYIAFAEHPFVSSKGVPVTAR